MSAKSWQLGNPAQYSSDFNDAEATQAEQVGGDRQHMSGHQVRSTGENGQLIHRSGQPTRGIHAQLPAFKRPIARPQVTKGVSLPTALKRAQRLSTAETQPPAQLPPDHRPTGRPVFRREPARIHHCRQDKWLKPRHSVKGGGPTGNRLAPYQHQPQPTPSHGNPLVLGQDQHEPNETGATSET